jgi:glycine/D-amino acid oxidase-like deaminating enzyme
MARSDPSRKASQDVIVVGGGVIGLAVSLLAVKRGMRVRVVDAGLAGAASSVAAGLLAPSLGRLSPAASAVFRDARDRYGDFVDLVREASGETLTVGHGILELADPSGQLGDSADGTPLARSDISRRYRDLAAASDGVLHPKDGWIDPGSLLRALRSALPHELIQDRVVEIELRPNDVRLLTAGQRWIHCEKVVIASGCWTPAIRGIPTDIPIQPAKGEVMILETDHSLETAVACGESYLVPRGSSSIVVGSTFEMNVDDPATTPAGQATLAGYASRLIPGAMARARARRGWAGLRPITPDRLPIIDRDLRDPRVIYAVGHGKNGLLLAGVTAEMVADLLDGNRLDPASPFFVGRFGKA